MTASNGLWLASYLHLGIAASAVPSPGRILRFVRETIEECWRKWQSLPARFRYSVYAGALLGLAFYPILGFCTAGVLKGTADAGNPYIMPANNPHFTGSIAATIHSSIGNVAAGSLFAIMQSLGAKGILIWLLPLLGAIITPAIVELIVWIHGRLLKLLRWLSSSLGVEIPTSVMELIQWIQDSIRSKVKLA